MKSPVSNFYCLHRAERNILSKSLPLYTHKLIYTKKNYLFQRTNRFILEKLYFSLFQACVKPSRNFPARGAVTPKEPTRLKPFTHAHEQTRFAVSLWRTHNCALRPSRSSRCSLVSARSGEQRATQMSRPIKQINT